MANELPRPCNVCAPDGGYWVEGPRGGAQRCGCARGERLAAAAIRPVPPSRAEPVLNGDEISAAVEGLSSMPFFPASEMARTMIGDAIGLLCRDGRSCFELVREMLVRYQNWPGVREMRICYCALVGSPLSGEDLHSAISEVYPDGFGGQIPSSPPVKALPPGRVSTADAQLDAAIQSAALVLGQFGSSRR